MKKNWPSIGEEEKNGAKRYVVDARIAFKGKRTGERRFFESKKEAEGYRQQVRAARQNEGPVSGIEELKEVFGWTLSEAVQFTLKHLRSQRSSVSVEEAAKALVETKRGAGFSERRCRDLTRQLLQRVGAHFNGASMREINTMDLERFLAGLDVKASTRNKYRQDLILLWRFAEKQGWAESSVAKTERARGDTAAPMILTTQQAESLLLASNDDELLAYHAIGLFAGLRVQEITKLDWQQINFESGFIDVTRGIAKTRTRRHAPLTDNLRAWLQPIAKLSGPIVSGSLRRRCRAARTDAGITTWQENILRHSFVSYRLAALGDSARVALEAGHDQKVLFNHYLNVVTPKQGEQYFQIRPFEPKKIVPMVA